MPCVLLIGDQWKHSDKLLVGSVDFNKKLRVTVPKFKDKLGTVVSKYDIYACDGKAAAAKPKGTPLDLGKSLSEQGVSDKGYLWFQKKGTVPPGIEGGDKKNSPSNPTKPPPNPTAKPPPNPTGPPPNPTGPPPNPTATKPPPNPTGPPPNPTGPPPNPTGPPPNPTGPPPNPTATKPPPNPTGPPPNPTGPPPNPTATQPPPVDAIPPPLDEVAKVNVEEKQPAAEDKKLPTPPAAVPTPPQQPPAVKEPPPAPVVEQPPAVAQPPGEPPVKAPPPAPTAAVPAPTPEVVNPIPQQVKATETPAIAKVEQPITTTPATVQSALLQQAAAVESVKSVDVKELMAAKKKELESMQEEMERLRQKRAEESNQAEELRRAQQSEILKREGSISALREEETKRTIASAVAESKRREESAKLELMNERKQFEEDRLRLEAQLGRLRSEDSEKRIDREQAIHDLELQKKRKQLEAEIANIEGETRKLNEKNRDAILLSSPPPEQHSHTHDTSLVESPILTTGTTGMKPGETTEQYRQRIQAMALQRLELEVQEEVITRDLKAAEKRRKMLQSAVQNKSEGSKVTQEPWWIDEGRGVLSPITRQQPQQQQQQRDTRLVSSTVQDRRRREAAMRRRKNIRNSSPSPSPSPVPQLTSGIDSTLVAEQTASQVVSEVQKRLTAELRVTSLTHQERLTAALSEMQQVKSELEKWREGFKKSPPMRSPSPHDLQPDHMIPPKIERPTIPVPKMAASIPPNLREYGLELMELMMEKAQRTEASQLETSPRPTEMSFEVDQSPFDLNSRKSREKELARMRGESEQQPTYNNYSHLDTSFDRTTYNNSNSNINVNNNNNYSNRRVSFQPAYGQQPQPQPHPPTSPSAIEEFPVGCKVLNDEQIVMPIAVARTLIGLQSQQGGAPLRQNRQELASPSASPSPSNRREYYNEGNIGAGVPVSPEVGPVHPWAGSPAVGHVQQVGRVSSPITTARPPQPALGGVLHQMYSTDVATGARSPAAVSLSSPHSSPAPSPDYSSSFQYQHQQPVPVQPYQNTYQPQQRHPIPAREAINQVRQVLNSYNQPPSSPRW